MFTQTRGQETGTGRRNSSLQRRQVPSCVSKSCAPLTGQPQPHLWVVSLVAWLCYRISHNNSASVLPAMPYLSNSDTKMVPSQNWWLGLEEFPTIPGPQDELTASKPKPYGPQGAALRMCWLSNLGNCCLSKHLGLISKSRTSRFSLKSTVRKTTIVWVTGRRLCSVH